VVEMLLRPAVEPRAWQSRGYQVGLAIMVVRWAEGFKHAQFPLPVALGCGSLD
jgi:hypothetical protein